LKNGSGGESSALAFILQKEVYSQQEKKNNPHVRSKMRFCDEDSFLEERIFTLSILGKTHKTSGTRLSKVPKIHSLLPRGEKKLTLPLASMRKE